MCTPILIFTGLVTKPHGIYGSVENHIGAKPKVISRLYHANYFQSHLINKDKHCFFITIIIEKKIHSKILYNNNKT